MITLTIRPMQSRHMEPLAELFPEKGFELFENYYLEHLQERRFVLVADYREEEAPLQVFGYVTLVWESLYTHFWRRRIPEIVDLNVAAPFRRQGIGSQLIFACEQRAAQRGYTHIGISVVQDDPDYAAANRLYPQLGYQPDGFGITPEDQELHLFKPLTASGA